MILALLTLTLLTVYFFLHRRFLHRRQQFEHIEVQAPTNHGLERLRSEDNPTVEQMCEFENAGDAMGIKPLFCRTCPARNDRNGGRTSPRVEAELN